MVRNRSELMICWLTLLLAWCGCAMPSSCSADPFDASRNAFRFDAGTEDATLDDGAIALTPTHEFSPATGYGWTRVPAQSFRRDDLSRSRDALTIDGVAGEHLEFRASVAPGSWSLLLWLEADAAEGQLSFFVQGKKQQLGWQRFTPPAEPRRSPQKTYRVVRTQVAVDSTGLNIELTSKGRPLRLMGFSLVRLDRQREPAQEPFLTRLAEAGRHDSDASLEELLQGANRELLTAPTEPFFLLWRERLMLLHGAERLFAQRGWEWARDETGLGMFERLHQAVMLIDGLLSAEPEQVQPLAERATYLRGRILYWLHRESGGKSERVGAARDLGNLRAKHTDDQLLAMYTGEKIDLPDACDDIDFPDNAPAWSVAQREALCRMRQIAHWWVNQQQAANGEFGGKLGDDVELLRWWAPLVLVGDRTAIEGWRKLAEGVWQSRRVHQGYAAQVNDVEHAAEFIADTAPMMVLLSDEPRYQQRLSYSARHFENLWTGRTRQGHRHFRSAWFSATKVETQEPKNRDVEYNTRAVQPMRYLAWRSQNPKVTALLRQWSLAWVDAAMRTDKGKPRGIIPPSVRFSDEAINGDEPTWYQANMFWKYFDWEHHVGSLMLDQLLLTYTLAQDDRLLQPMQAALELIRTQEKNLGLGAERYKQGSATWAAQQLVDNELFWQVVEQWRFRYGDTHWDKLLLRYGTPYGRYRIGGDERQLELGLEQLLEGIRYNTPLMTTEAIHTDRVYVPRAELLKAMLTGDGVTGNVSPYYAVTWEETDENFTALVSEATTDRLVVRLYSHSPTEQTVALRIWQLIPGEYRLHQDEIASQEVSSRPVTIERKGQRLPIVLPVQQEVRITLTRKRRS